MKQLFGFLAVVAAVGCSSGGSQSILSDIVYDTSEPDQGGGEVHIKPNDSRNGDIGDEDLADTQVDAPRGECAPGDGCFLDPCTDNKQCQAGWCLDHMGEGVCTQTCQEECPQGWSCKLLGAGGPDPVSVCVSGFANLCKPCSASADCKSPGGADDLCLDYGDAGSFCGGKCKETKDCPWGFTCKESQSVDGTLTMQCIADAGVCPCTKKSIEMGLFTPCDVSNEFGECQGKRVCEEGGLSACSAATPMPEVCNGLDDDCDGETDEDSCDDGNECTKDTCLGEEGCEHLPLEGGECKDGNPCTVADHCVQGVCVGDPVICDDKNLCTENVCTENGGCNYPPLDIPCDDNDPCTVADRCEDSVCKGVPVDCDCQSNQDCLPLEDGDVCNGTLICQTEKLPYQCAVDPGTVITCPPPTGPDAPCLASVCDPLGGTCSFEPVNPGFPCEDGDLCTLGDSCKEGVCAPGPEINCNDGNPCTTDSCDPATGCLNVPNDAPCDDGNPCTLADVCGNGVCVGGQQLDCDDGNPCTNDLCDPKLGCTHTFNTADCDDGNPCTTGDKCINGSCGFAALLPCSDDNPCTTDLCDPASGGCVFKLNTAPCDDGNPCTSGDQCNLGACVGKIAIVCNDGNPCTSDACDPLKGCVYLPKSGQCDDGNACTTSDYCSAGKCVAGGVLACDDGNPCTTDTCDPVVGGCVYQPNSAPCDDGNFCTAGDYCHLSQCKPGKAIVCDDGNPCTDDSCLPQVGCVFKPNAAPCDDLNACTIQDACKNGWCIGAAVTCDDSNPCTDDLCDPIAGCVSAPNQAPCEDGNPCSVNDQCQNGVCQPGTPADCDDGNPCTDDSCTNKGCVYIANKGGCEDGNACTENDYCVDTVCIPGAPVVCNDKNPCTNDSCDPAKGCLFQNNTLPCNDGNLCTDGDVCADGKCKPGQQITCNDGIACTQDSCDPAVGCVFLPGDCCGNNTIQPGEDCDDGNKNPGDGCNEFCQFENYTMTVGLTPNDMAVANDGSFVVVGIESNNVVAECWRSDRTKLRAKFTAFSTCSGCEIEHLHVAMARKTRHFIFMARHQTKAGDYGSRMGTYRLFDPFCQPVGNAVMFESESMDEYRDIAMDDTGHAMLVWGGKSPKRFLKKVDPDGTDHPAVSISYSGCKFMTHIALKGGDASGVVTCQGHANEPIYFLLFDKDGNVTKSYTQVQGTPPSSWYDSHTVGMNGNGQFMVVWARSSDDWFKAALHDAAGQQIKVVDVGQAPTGCYDPYRDWHVPVATPNNSFVLPYIAPGYDVCWKGNFRAFSTFSAQGNLVKNNIVSYPTQTLRMDGNGSTYVFSGNQVHMNKFKVF